MNEARLVAKQQRMLTERRLMDVNFDAKEEEERMKLARAREARKAEMSLRKNTLLMDVETTTTVRLGQQMAMETQKKQRADKKINEQRLESRVDAALAASTPSPPKREATTCSPKSEFQQELDEKKKKAMQRVERQEQQLIKEEKRLKEQREVEEKERARRLQAKEREEAKALRHEKRLEQLQATVQSKKEARKADAVAIVPNPEMPRSPRKHVSSSPHSTRARPEQQGKLPQERRGDEEQGLSPEKTKPELRTSSLTNTQQQTKKSASKLALATSPPHPTSRKQRKLQFDRLAAALKSEGCPEKEVNLCLEVEDLQELQRLHGMKRRELAKKEAKAQGTRDDTN